MDRRWSLNLLDKSEDQCKEMNSNTLYSKGDSETDHLKTEITGCINLYEIIQVELIQIQEFITK